MPTVSFGYTTTTDSSAWTIDMFFPLALEMTDQELIDFGEELNRDDLLGAWAFDRDLTSISISGLGRTIPVPPPS